MTGKEAAFLVVVAAMVVLGVAVVPTVPRERAGASTAVVRWDAVRDDPAHRLTFTWMGCPAYPTAKDGTWPEKRVEDAFNVDLRPIFNDWQANQNRKPLVLSSGDIPDVVWDGDPLYVRRNIHHGFVMEIPYEVILKHAPTYVKHLNRYGREAWLYSFYRGKNYGIPTFAAADIFPPASAWRMDWLRKVGIRKVPETLAEAYEAYRRFRHEDPDGNGKKDTYGLCPPIHWSLTFADEFAAHGILPQDFLLRDGRVVWGGILPEAREVLAELRRWYQEELIDPDFAIGTQGGRSTDQKFTNGKTGYLYQCWEPSLDLANPNSLYSTMRKLNPAVELASGKPLIGRDGRRRRRVWGGPGHVIWFGRPVEKHPEKVIRVLRMFEAFATDRELFLESRIGRRGLHWEWSPERGLYPLPPYDERGADTRNMLGFGPLENCYGFYSACSAPLEFTNPYLKAGILEYRERTKNPAWGLKNAVGKSDVVESAERYLEDLRQFQMTTYIEIVRGDKPLEYFDEFVRLWKARGGDVLTREANEMLQEMQAIYRKVGVEE